MSLAIAAPNYLSHVESMPYRTVNARLSWTQGISLSLSLAISRTDIKKWCTEHDYELLELEKSTTSETEETEEENDDDDDESQCKKRKREREGRYASQKTDGSCFVAVYPDVYGIPRLLQTLHVHQWPNMDLKGRIDQSRHDWWSDDCPSFSAESELVALVDSPIRIDCLYCCSAAAVVVAVGV